MNKQEARRLTVLRQLEKQEITQRRGAELLKLSLSHMKVLCRKFKEQGPSSVVHGNLGRTPANAITSEVKEEIIRLYRSTYAGFNVSHFHEKLTEVHGMDVSRVSVHRILTKRDIQSPRKHKKRKRHHRRDPRPREGELSQLDASKHDWFENGSYCHLHGAIDDAKSEVIALHFEKEETTAAYFSLMWQVNDTTGMPLSLYTDKRGVFTNNRTKDALSMEEQLAGVNPQATQFSRAMDQIGIDIILASSPEAKGRVERLWGTLQDRLIKEMKLAGITTMEAANAWLPSFIKDHNRRFAHPPKESESAYLPRIPEKELELILCHQEQRTLDRGSSFSYYNKYYALPTSINAQPGQTLTVLESPRFGIKVRITIKGKTTIVRPKELMSRPKKQPEAKEHKSIQEMTAKRSEYGRMGATLSPWSRFDKSKVPKEAL